MRFHFLLLFVFIVVVSCTQQHNNDQLQTQITNLQKQLNESYKPGLGELMENIQIHHNKLYFAGENSNWELSKFEINEIKESLEDIEKYCSDREEIKSISIIKPAIDSLTESINEKNLKMFNSSFTFFTNSCNNCHIATKFEFNIIKIPQTPPFTNQEFKLNGSK